MPTSPIEWTWANISRAIGVLIIVSLLGAFLAAFILQRTLNTTVVLAFLGVATSLIGLPSGLQVVLRNSNGGSQKPPSSS